MFFFIVLFVLVLIVLIVVAIVRRKNPARLKWTEIGIIIDRALRAYRRNLVPLLALAVLCAPIGVITYASVFSFFLDGARLDLASPRDNWGQMLGRIVTTTIVVMGSLGFGKTLLACGTAPAIYDDSAGQPVSLGRMLSRQRWGATLGLMVRMIVPSLLNAFFGYLGALLTLSWRVAPAALIFEQLGARDAIKQGRELVKPVRTRLADVLVPLWLIGWLIVGAPLLGGFWLLGLLVALSPEMIETLTLIGWIIGSVFVTPLMALGAIQFYLYVRERSLEQAVHNFAASGDIQPATGGHAIEHAVSILHNETP